jgi:hypothetical protein
MHSRHAMTATTCESWCGAPHKSRLRPQEDLDLLVRAAQGAGWLTDLPLANRLADAIGSGPRLMENVLVEQQAWLRSSGPVFEPKAWRRAEYVPYGRRTACPDFARYSRTNVTSMLTR